MYRPRTTPPDPEARCLATGAGTRRRGNTPRKSKRASLMIKTKPRALLVFYHSSSSGRLPRARMQILRTHPDPDPPPHTQRPTNTHTHRHRHMYAQTHMHTLARAPTHTFTHMHARTLTHTHTHKHTRAHTQVHTKIYKSIDTHRTLSCHT